MKGEREDMTDCTCAQSPVPGRALNPHEAKDAALKAFAALGEAHRNCAQAVLLYTVLRLGLSRQDAVEHARYLGGGVARLGHLCGLLTGSALALAVRDVTRSIPTSASSAYQELATLFRDFEHEFGHVNCASLTGCDLSKPSELDQFQSAERKLRCQTMASWVLDKLETLLHSG